MTAAQQHNHAGSHSRLANEGVLRVKHWGTLFRSASGVWRR
jgi:hypothetical protein